MCERKTACSSVTSLIRGQAEELEAAAVGQDRPVPAHEAVQAAQVADHLLAGPQGQVIGVGQHHLGPGLAELVDFQPFDAGLGGHGHEGGQIDRAVGRRERAPPRGRARIAMLDAEGERGICHGIYSPRIG